MPLLDGEGVPLRQADAEERTLLVSRCAMWTDLRCTAEMRLPLLPEELPPARRVRGRYPALSTGMREDEVTLRTSLH